MRYTAVRSHSHGSDEETAIPGSSSDTAEESAKKFR